VNSSFPPPPERPRPLRGLPRDLAERQVEALAVAMVVAPGVYPRNRMFDLFSLPGARRARTRAGLLRGLIPQLARACDVTIAPEPGGLFTLRYVIEAVRLTRVVALTATELAALRVALERAGVGCLAASAGDRELVTQTLATLMDDLTAS
jgi:hypothetical protein